MSNFLTGPVQVIGQTLHSSSADQYHKLGELVFANDGRAFRYALAGGTALVAGNMYSSQAEDTDTEDMTAVAAAVGDLSIASTTTVTVTANEYAEGFILVSVTPGVGKNYKIKGHIAYTAAAPTFNLDESVVVALTTTSRLDALANPFRSVIVSPTTLTGVCVGAAVHAVASAEYGWLQVLGSACVEVEGTLSVGLPVVTSDTDIGTVETIADGAHELLQIVGVAQTAGSAGEFAAVKLNVL